jgi:hypothetical protein
MSDRRLERLVVLVTPAEKTSIREAAGNVPLSAYMRGKLLGTPAGTPKKPAENPVAGTPETSPEKSDRRAVRVRQLQAQGHTARSARQIAEQEEA